MWDIATCPMREHLSVVCRTLHKLLYQAGFQILRLSFSTAMTDVSSADVSNGIVGKLNAIN